jgi:hypothetical protein
MARIKSGGERAYKVTSMQRHLEAWKNSGLSQRAYLDTTGVSKTLFSYWQHKFRPAACSTPVSSGFVPVAPPTIPSGAVSSERVFARIRCSDGRELLLHEEVSSDYLRAWLTVERTISWTNFFRRIVKDYEYTTQSSVACLIFANMTIMLQRIND